MLTDLNLLHVFNALWLERNVSRAGQRLGLGQPAMSARLQRLRDALGDPLFVRSIRGLTPTPQAIELAPLVSAALASCEQVTVHQQKFDPATLHGRIVISSTDYFDLLALPHLIPLVVKEAPNLQIVTRTVGDRLPKDDLEGGRVDIAIAGYFNEIPDGFYRQKIFSDTYCSAVADTHPLVRDQLSLTDFLSLPHLLISPQGDLQGAVDRALAHLDLKRRVVAGIGNFHAAGAIIAHTDLILTAPRQLLRSYALHLPIKIFPPPLDVPGFSVVQVWHERTHQDPSRMWLRQLIQRVCSMVWDP